MGRRQGDHGKDQHNDQNRHKGHAPAEIQILKAVIANIAHHQNTRRRDDQRSQHCKKRARLDHMEGPHRARHDGSCRRTGKPDKVAFIHTADLLIKAPKPKRGPSHIEKGGNPPKLPSELRIQVNATSAGATPNATMSARLSYSSPNLLWVLVSLATRPSKPSSTIEIKMATAALVNAPFMPATMA